MNTNRTNPSTSSRQPPRPLLLTLPLVHLDKLNLNVHRLVWLGVVLFRFSNLLAKDALTMK